MRIAGSGSRVQCWVYNAVFSFGFQGGEEQEIRSGPGAAWDAHTSYRAPGD